jgi:hypothetical protein
MLSVQGATKIGETRLRSVNIGELKQNTSFRQLVS